MIIKGILVAVGFVLAILGLCELIHTLRIFSLAPRKSGGAISVVWLKPDFAVDQVSFMAEQLYWFGNDFARYVVAVTDAIGEQELENCRSVGINRNIIFCTEAVLLGLLQRLSVDE